MRLTVATVEIAGGEVGELVAEHLEKKPEWRLRQFRGDTNHATLELDAPE